MLIYFKTLNILLLVFFFNIIGGCLSATSIYHISNRQYNIVIGMNKIKSIDLIIILLLLLFC